MSDFAEFKARYAELERLRSRYLQLDHPRDNILAERATELGRKQLSLFQTVNGLFTRFSSAPLSDHLENGENATLMPNRDAARNLIAATKTTFEIYKEGARNRDVDLDANKTLIREKKGDLNQKLEVDLNSREFNRDFRNSVRFFGNDGNEETTRDGNGTDDLTINTIASDDVMASSPI